MTKQILFAIIIIYLSGCSEDISQKSIVRVKTGIHFATGFFITPNAVITSAHLIRNVNDHITIRYINDNADVLTTSVTVISIDYDYDQVILYAANAIGKPVKICSGNILNRVKAWAWIDKKPVSTSGLIFWKWGNKYWTNADTINGYSGGPVAKGDCVIALHKAHENMSFSLELKPQF